VRSTKHDVPVADDSLTVLRRVEPCMGTVFSLDVRAPAVDDSAIDDVLAWLHRVESTFSTYRTDSEISRIGRGELAVADASPQVAEILRRCEELERETDGYFSAYPDGRLDPSGLVKGWAIERASDRLRAAGAANHSLNGGGDVQCAGSAAPGRPWRIGVIDPSEPGRVLAVVAGDDLAVATSGTAERGAHVLDPHTHAPVTALASVTVAGRHLGTADAYATAAFAMGGAAPDWLAGLRDYRSFVVFPDGGTWASPGFAGQP
jgi:thiamine biosynthesis lipoprotein